MVCPQCGYMMTEYDLVCPRCHGHGVAPKANVSSPSNTSIVPQSASTQPLPPVAPPAPPVSPVPPVSSAPQTFYPQQPTNQASSAGMNDVRRGVSQAKYNEDAAKFVIWEILVASIILGVKLESWWMFGISLIVSFVIINIKPLAGVFGFLFSVLWAVVGWAIGEAIGNTGASVVLSVLAFLISMRLHMAAFEWVQDINADR